MKTLPYGGVFKKFNILSKFKCLVRYFIIPSTFNLSFDLYAISVLKVFMMLLG